MSYYDEDKGYVGYDPLEAAEERIHKEQFHKEYVPSTEELLCKLYHHHFTEESKKLTSEPVSSGDWLLDGLSKSLYDSIGDIRKRFELIAEDHLKHNDELRLCSTTSEHMICEGKESQILYKTTHDGLKVMGVFLDKDYAEKIIKMGMEEMIVDDE